MKLTEIKLLNYSVKKLRKKLIIDLLKINIWIAQYLL